MTETEAIEAEAEWAKYHDEERIIRSLQTIGATKKDLEKEQKSLFKKISLHDAYNSLLHKSANKHKDFHFRKMAHLQIAIDLSRNNEDYLPHLKKAAKYELLKYKQDNVTKVEIMSAGNGNACPECQKQSGNIYDIDEALIIMPIPCKTCSHTSLGDKPGYCRCTYVASFTSA